jgi:hypothetical protein
MATLITPSPSRLEPAIDSLLARLRRRILAYVWVDGVAKVAAVTAACFWASLALDRLFELPWPLRIAVLAGTVTAIALTMFGQLIVRLFVQLQNRSLALLLERRFDCFHDSLLTSVELTDAHHAGQFDPVMLAHTRRDAAARAVDVDLRQVFNTRPLVRHVSLALVLVGAVPIAAVAAPETLGIWARRNLLMSNELWPRLTRLVVEGFDEQDHVKIARGSDWPLTVHADAARDRWIPEIVEVRYRTTDGARGRENMVRDGVVTPGESPFQNYGHTFKSVLAPLEFYVHGGDDRRGPFTLDVVDSPTISRMILHCEYPPYMHRTARDIPVAGLMPLPRGTTVTIHAEANKPLVSVQIDDMADENTPVTHTLEIAAENGQPPESFEFALPPLQSDKSLLFTLRDHDGIRSRDAVRLTLAAIADEPPQVNVQLRGIGTAITAAARLPAAGDVTDDYGIAKIWFETRVSDGPPSEQPFAAQVDGQEKLEVNGALEVRDLQLEPKQKLQLAVLASDTLTLEGGPNVGNSQRYVLDVVTPEQLRSMLEARELVLRRRFETIVDELTDTRNLLATLKVGPLDAPGEDEKSVAHPPGDTDVGEKQDAASRVVQLERVLQNSQRSAHETLQVALAFDELREEMINNRVDTEELKIRLRTGWPTRLRRSSRRCFRNSKTG